MKALFGMVSLLVVLAIVGLLAVKQMRAVGQIGATAATGATPATADAPAPPAMSGSGTVREQSVQLQKRIGDDVTKALNQGAAARRQEADK